MEKTRVRVGRNIRNLRRRRNLSQKQLAKLSGIPKSTLNHIEAGSSAPSIEVVEALANGLSVSLEELISGGTPLVEIRHKKSMPQLRSTLGSTIHRILPDPFSGIDFYFCEMKPLTTLSGVTQNSSGKKLVFCITGSIHLKLNGEDYLIEEGGTGVFPGDFNHTFVNKSEKKVQFLKVHYYASAAR